MKCTICNENELTGKQELYCSKRCKFKSQNVRHQNYEAQQRRARKRKLEAINLKGGQCEICGYRRNYSALVFHHLDPSQKDFGLDSRKFSNTSIEKLKDEVAKCQLVCHNCHMEIHNPSCQL